MGSQLDSEFPVTYEIMNIAGSLQVEMCWKGVLQICLLHNLVFQCIQLVVFSAYV